ncbi:TolC family protein [Hydrogenophaga pseudoflava]|uniref:TolC family protein n=1 Tax=Hydrogenophaga pseudoflava TaxID=47421 RepID=UPI0027E4C3B1|nr:TolC family protein [Hydrogenophaga pseudoflava]MDQ7746602.1 TolC family protein [Hydrogenophaga pseudoflava]
MSLPFALAAQTTSPSQEADWRRANDAVGAFKRGHVDVLKWEQANPTAGNPAAAPTGAAVATPEAAVRMAWRVHKELARPLARLGDQNERLIAEGRWTELDPSLQRRVEDASEVLEVAAAGRKAWIEAVAAQQVLKHQRDMLEAAQAAHELGQRMVTVGNWSKLQLAPVQLALSNARMNLRRAEHAAAQAQSKLVESMGQTGLQDGFALPDRLPDIPAQPMAAADLQKRAEAVRNQLPVAQSLRNRALSRTAMSTYRAAHALAQDSQGDILKTREFITEETVLHYNGMLKSVWDLLDEVRNQSQATVDAIGAQRDFWLAEADLQWVLQGGEPDSFVGLGGAGGDAPAAAAH